MCLLKEKKRKKVKLNLSKKQSEQKKKTQFISRPKKSINKVVTRNKYNKENLLSS